MNMGMPTRRTSERLVWSIGDPTQGRWRYRDAWSGTGPDDELVYVVGASDPLDDWPRVHPGPLNASTGFRTKSAAIEFDAAEHSETGWHVLELHALASHGPCPDILVTLNDRRALVVSRPVRVDYSHEPSPSSPTAGLVNRELVIPPGSVTAGHNRLVLTTMADHQPDPAELRRGQRPDLGVWFGSALTWNNLVLRRIDENVAEPTLLLEPLPLYIRNEQQLSELVDLVIIGAHHLADAVARVTIGEHDLDVPIDTDGRDFGDIRVRFPVCEVTGATEACARVDLGGTSLSTRLTFRPSRRWTVHLIPHVHLDIGYTDMQAKVLELHSHNLDRALDLTDQQPDYAFSIDGSCIVETFLRSRAEYQRRRALSALRAGRISVNAFWALLLTGVATLEELYRATYVAADLSREHGIPLTYANLTDVPSYTWAIPSVLTAAGIPAFMGMANHTRGGNADSDQLHLQSPVRWEGPDGNSVLAFFADCYSQLRLVCADPPTLVGSANGLVRFLGRYDHDGYIPHDIPLVGTHADNEDLSHGYADLAERWNATYAWPRLRYSTIADYLATIEPLTDQLPMLRGDGGSYWEDGVGTQARAVSTYRRAQMLLPAAETVGALVAAVTDEVTPDTDSLDHGWQCLLIGCEHTWTSAHATARPHAHQTVHQLDWKVSHIEQGMRIATDECQRAASQLAARVTTTRVPSLLVINPSSWSRTLYVDVELEATQIPHGPRDPLGSIRDGMRWWRLRVDNVPAFGYRVLPLHEGPTETLRDQPVPEDLETTHYELTIESETGRFLGLRHKLLDRQLLDQTSPWSLGEVLYVTGGGTGEGRGLGEETNRLVKNDPMLPAPELSITTVSTHATALRRAPWGWTIIVEGSGPSLPHVRTELRLYEDTDQVEVTIALDKEAVLAKESIYVAFPFAITNPVVRYDRQQGWVSPAVDHQPGACNEWLTAQYAVALSDDDLAVVWTPVDAPLFTVGDIVRGDWPTRFEPDSGTLFSWVMNNYWFTNTPAYQEGHVELRYAFKPARDFDAADAARFGRSVRTPALVGDITYTDRCDDEPRPLPATGVLLKTEATNNIAIGVYAGRHHNGPTVRVQETAGRPGNAVVWHPDPGSQAWAQLCAATETPQALTEIASDGAVRLQVMPYQVTTLTLGKGADR